jgi:glycosyltransferase involved in cell wall biosynthesis
MKKKVTIVTHIDFWIFGAGHRARLLSLISVLSQVTELSIFYVGTEKGNNRNKIRSLPFTFNFFDVKQNVRKEFRDYLHCNPVDVCIIEYIELSPLINEIPQGIKVFLDTHDLVCEKNKKFKEFNTVNRLKELTRVQEFAIFRRFHKVILIQEEEYRLVKGILGRDKVLLAPHSVNFSQKKIRKNVKNIGFIASEYYPNIEGFQWFTNNVWPKIDSGDFFFSLYGRINNQVKLETKRIHQKGFILDLNSIYEETDIIINPVRFGAGLKIKNVEALGNGLPLITTSHGASGLRQWINSAYLVADEAEDFADQLNSLINDYSLRKKLGAEAYNVSQKHFSSLACYSELIKAINQ